MKETLYLSLCVSVGTSILAACVTIGVLDRTIFVVLNLNAAVLVQCPVQVTIVGPGWYSDCSYTVARSQSAQRQKQIAKNFMLIEVCLELLHAEALLIIQTEVVSCNILPSSILL